jgi:DNA polymerase-3 subunit alpha
MTKKFAHLHVHSSYSLLDGISQRVDLIRKTKEFGQPGLAMTEHGNIFAAITFYKDCLAAGVVPAIGMEAYIAPDTRLGREYSKKGEAAEDAKNGDLSMSAYHLTILSKNRQGYENLKRLSSEAFRDGFYRKPRIDDEILEKYKGGLIVLSGCLASKTSRLIVAGQKDKALEEVDKMRRLFGDDFFLEVMDHHIDEEKVVRGALLEFSKTHGIGTVFTGDSHFTEHGDAYAHEIALAIGIQKTIKDPDRWKFNGDGYWFKSTDEMADIAVKADIPEEALTNTFDIIKRIEDYGFDLASKHQKPSIPLFRDDLGNAYTNDDCHLLLHMKALNGLSERGLAGQPAYDARMDEELEMIKSKDFSSYFLIIGDIVDFMRKKGILPPIGRGSSMGSLVCYSMFITGLDPIFHEIPFSRFINPGRKDLPDIDTDISQERRKEVIDYIAGKYGVDRVAQIVTFQTMGAKGSLDNVGRALGVPSAIRKQVGKIIGDITKDDKLIELVHDNKKLDEMLKQVPNWLEVALKLEGNNRNLGAHAAGIVISNQPLIEHTPFVRDSKEGHLVTQFDMKDLTELGLLKLDMLGLKTMDLIQHTLELVKKDYGIDIDFQKIPLVDDATYQLIATGKFVSVFQYDSGGLRAAAKQLQPNRFDHLVALNALYRPGPMLKDPKTGKSIMDQYIDRRHGREPIETWHPELDRIFEPTLGLCLFQESVMNMSKIIAGFNDLEADEYRAAIGKKDKVKFEAAQNKFIQRGISFGREPRLMQDLAHKLEGFARYGWNVGHSKAYSYISYVTAFLEAHYPHQYYATLLNVNIDDADQLKILLAAIMRSGIKISVPEINKSHQEFHTDGKVIYMGLLSVRNVGESAAGAIFEDRAKHGPYATYLDFCLRMVGQTKVNKLTKENLVKAGAFDWDCTMTSSDKVANTELIGKAVKKFAAKVAPADLPPMIQAKLAITGIEYSKQVKLANEGAVLNFFISSHPVSEYAPLFSLFPHINFITPCQLQEQDQGNHAVMLGVVDQKVVKTTKTGKPYVNLVCSDQFDAQHLNIWEPLATQYANQIINGQIVMLAGGIRDDKLRPGENQLNINSVVPITAVAGGIPVREFMVAEERLAMVIATVLGATVADLSKAILKAGHRVVLSQTVYIRPEHFNELRAFKGRVHYEIAL